MSALIVGIVVFATTALAAGVLAVRRSARAGGALLAFYAAQGLVVFWIAHALDSLGLACAMSAAWTLVMVHRVLTYAYPAPPRSWDLLSFVPVHVAQATFVLWVIAWPLSRLSVTPLGDAVVIGGVPLVSALGLALTHRTPAVRAVSLDVPGLSGELRVVHLSDLHVGPYMGRAQLARIAAAVNALRADLIAMTGDFLTLRSELDYTPLLDFVRALERPTLGVYACLGTTISRCESVWSPISRSPACASSSTRPRSSSPPRVTCFASPGSTITSSARSTPSRSMRSRRRASPRWSCVITPARSP
ncbi:MAG: hypothetical protein KF819_40665 [Labilithrix sp.]|nr:hypothetical protein [Labilithrix sp.]